MKRITKKILKMHWLIKQSLTKKPADKYAKVSDLFFWRRGRSWDTYFELLNFPAIFGDTGDYFSDIVFFDQTGSEVYTYRVDLLKLDRQILKVSEIIDQKKNIGEVGTFAVFHSKMPDSVIQSNSWITERGYVSYRYKNSPLRCYVHGNYDAIAKINNKLQFLSGISLIKRVYQLQFIFLPDTNYEVVIVNPCSKVNKYTIQVLSMKKNRTILDVQVCVLTSGAMFVFPIRDLIEPCRVVIKSRSVMARPVIFSNSCDKVDVFHG